MKVTDSSILNLCLKSRKEYGLPPFRPTLLLLLLTWIVYPRLIAYTALSCLLYTHTYWLDLEGLYLSLYTCVNRCIYDFRFE